MKDCHSQRLFYELVYLMILHYVMVISSKHLQRYRYAIRNERLTENI